LYLLPGKSCLGNGRSREQSRDHNRDPHTE